MGFTHAQVRRRGRLQGNQAIPFLCGCGYDGNVARDTIRAWSDPKNRSTQMWENRSDFVEIVRWKFGRKYDESEARNTSLELPLAALPKTPFWPSVPAELFKRPALLPLTIATM